MAGIGAESLAGGIAALFTDPDEINRIYKNEALNTGVNEQAGLASQYSKANQLTLADYNNALQRYRPLVQDAAVSDMAALGTSIGQSLNYNPLDTYEQIRRGNLAAFDQQAGRLADRGGLADRMALAARGYGGRGAGSYEMLLRNDRAGKNLAPVLAQIFGGLGADTGAITSGRNANFAQILAAIQGRQSIPQNALQFEYAPIGARNAALMGQANVLNSLSDTTARNFGGFNVIEDKWKTFARGMGQFVDQAADAYLQYQTGGLAGGSGGGMLGGMGGGGGGSKSSAPQSTPSGSFANYLNGGYAQSPSGYYY